jgi:hypothetical protein
MDERRILAPPPKEVASHELAAHAAGLARRLAALLEATCSPESGGAAAAAFLRRWADAAAGRPAAERSGPLDGLAERFALSAEERDLLLLAGLPDEHEGLASTFRSLHPRSEPRSTVGLAALLLMGAEEDRARLRRLLAGGALVRHGLVQLVGEGTFYERSLVPAERLWDALHGHDAWPASVERIAVDEPAAGLDRWVDLPAARQAVQALRSADDRTLLVPAGDDVVAVSRCVALAAAARRPLVGGRVQAGDRAATALVVAHAAVRGAVPVIVLPAAAEGGPPLSPALDLERVPGPILVCAPPGSARPVGRRPVLGVPLGPIRPGDHRRAWRAALPELAEHVPALAARHPLDPALTAQVAADVRSHLRLPGGTVDLREISGAIRARAGASLPAGVELATPSVPWARLVLPDEPAAQLRDAVARLDHESLVLDDWGFLDGARADRGVRMLFTGPPGTGKSLAAEVVATAVGTDLLVVDVSRVVSKWIGETEKNLAAIFDVAERTQAVLLLDEADALFGMRTEISDAHDRYANLETAYLLQRLDRFDGLAVLTTNLRQNIDPAFVRRIDFVVEFTLPDEARRGELWRLHLPRATLADDVRVDLLARLYPVPGGWIRNAAIAAAYLAAPAAGPIYQHHLVHAMRREYAKAVRPFPGEPIRPPGSRGSTARRRDERSG